MLNFSNAVKILGTLRRVGVACHPSKNINAVAKVCQGKSIQTLEDACDLNLPGTESSPRADSHIRESNAGIIDPSAELCYVDTGSSFLGHTFSANAFTTCFLNAAERNWNKVDKKQQECPTLSDFVDYDACSALMEVSSDLIAMETVIMSPKVNICLTGLLT